MRWATRWILVKVLGLALALLTVEAVMRGYAYIPSEGGTKTWNREGNAVSSWRDGIRLPISDGAERILVLGDSYTAALHVADGETFCSQAERLLHAAGVDATLLNAGLQASSLPDHILRGRTLVAQQRASWTVVVVNDDDFGASAWSKANVHFVQVGDKLEVRRASEGRGRLDAAMKPLRGRSAAVQNALLQFKGFVQMTSAWRPFRAEAQVAAPAKRKPEREFPVEAELALAQAAFGGRVTFMHLGVGGSVVTATEERFRRACQALRLDCVTTREELAALRRQGTPPQGFPNSGWDTGHLNHWGHRAVADVLAGALSHGLL